MNENRKLYIVLIVSAIIVFLTGSLVYANYKEEKKVYDAFLEKFNGDEPTLFYVGRPTCSYCNLLNISLDEMKQRYAFEDHYINIDEIGQGTLQKILSHFNVTNVGTPYLVIAAKGKIIDVQNGFIDYDQLFAFLQENGVIKSDAKLSLDYINFSTYKTKLAENKLNVVVIGQSLCQYCAAAKLELNKLVDENPNAEINYLNLTYLTDAQVQELDTSLEYLQGKYGTPVMLIVKNGKLVDKLEGLQSTSIYKQFLQKNGVL